MVLLDKVQALIKFLNGKPVQTLSRGLDCTKEFTLRQITYAYTVTIALVSLSMLSIIIPSSVSNTTKTFSIVNENTNELNTVNSKQNRSSSRLNSLFRLVSTAPKKAIDIAQHLVPNPKKIRSQWFPLTLVWTYKLSRPSELNFFFVLKPVNTYLQVPILTEKKADEKPLSAGLYLEGIKMISPSFPLIKNQVSQAKSFLLSYFGYFTRNINNFLDDTLVTDISNDENPDIVFRQVESASSQANLTENIDQSFNESSINLVRANSISPNRDPYRQNRVERDSQHSGTERLRSTNTSEAQSSSRRLGGSFKSFKNHALQSMYFRVDLLRTFVLRIEP